MLKDVIDTAINALDHVELQSFGNRVIAIPTGSVSTLNFSLSEAERESLYESGYETGKQFFAPRIPRTGSTPSRQHRRRRARRAARCSEPP